MKFLDQAVTIDKGAAGTDKVNNFQKIIGAVNQANTIDAIVGAEGVSLNVNLANNSLGINMPGVGTQQFEVVNFVNVVGSKSNDSKQINWVTKFIHVSMAFYADG